jgi:hypothetical protein
MLKLSVQKWNHWPASKEPYKVHIIGDSTNEGKTISMAMGGDFVPMCNLSSNTSSNK